MIIEFNNKYIKTLLYTILYLLLSVGISNAQGIKFQKDDLGKLLTKAQKKKKLVFIDTYASWCGPCKIMEKNVFPLEEVSSYYNKQFICTKIDMETPKGDAFSTLHKTESIPTFYYMAGTGEVIFKKTGGTDKAAEFIEYGQAAKDVYDLKLKGKKISNLRSVLHYAYFLKEASDSSYNEYLHRFLGQQSDWNSPENMKIILELAEEEGSPALNYFLTHTDSFAVVLGESAVSEKRLLLVLDRTLEFLQSVPKGQNPDMDKAAPIFKKYFGEASYKEHFLLFQFRYYQQNGDYPNMQAVLRRFIDEVVAPMPDGREKAVEYINTAATYYEAAQDDPKLKAEALQWGEKAIELDQSADIYSILSILCRDAGLFEKADLYEQKANQVRK